MSYRTEFDAEGAQEGSVRRRSLVNQAVSYTCEHLLTLGVFTKYTYTTGAAVSMAYATHDDCYTLTGSCNTICEDKASIAKAYRMWNLIQQVQAHTV